MGLWKDFIGEQVKIRFTIEGIMPERALLRLKRAKIDVYHVKKTQKNRILFRVKKKDSEKVFAIFPKACYNNSVPSVYTAERIGVVGVWRVFERLKKRTGLILGALLFCAITLFADGFIFGVRFVGTDTYAREAVMALEENGIKPFARYVYGKEDLVCAKLLKQKGVAFCSVKKQGLHAVVEVRLSPFLERAPIKGDMLCRRSGTLLSLTTLRGTPLKKCGETIEKGETLVAAYFQTQSGERNRVEVIARASIACVYAERVQATSKEEAFAKAYLKLGLSDVDEITEKSVEQKDGAYLVTIAYTAVQTMNF